MHLMDMHYFMFMTHIVAHPFHPFHVAKKYQCRSTQTTLFVSQLQQQQKERIFIATVAKREMTKGVKLNAIMIFP